MASRVPLTQVVVARVIQENETETDRESSDSRAKPMDRGIRGPCEDEQSDGNQPTRHHHRDQTLFSWRLATVLLANFQVMLVHQRRAYGAENNTDGEGYEHQTSYAFRITFALLVDDGIPSRN